MAEKAGAAATIVVNNVPGDPVAMAADPAFTTSIPAVMAGLDDKDALLALAGTPVTIGSQNAYTTTGNDNIMASFSSQGPTDVDYRVKPDLVAPGVNVLSSIPHTFCTDPGPIGCWAFFQGTSMASPHLAGTAAVVRAAHPGWTAEQVRSAITNTAQEDVLTQSSTSTPWRPTRSSSAPASMTSTPPSTPRSRCPRSAPPSAPYRARSGKPQTKQLTHHQPHRPSALNLPVSIDGADADAFSVDTGTSRAR